MATLRIMSRRRGLANVSVFLSLVFGFALCSLSTLRTGAQNAPLLYDISSAGNPQNSEGNYGFDFSFSNPERVLSLGLWDDGSDGLNASHQVGIFDEATMALVTSATVDNSSTVVPSADSNGRWLFTTLPTPVVLDPGTV